MNSPGSEPLLPLGFVCPVSEPESVMRNGGETLKGGGDETVNQDTGEGALIFSLLLVNCLVPFSGTEWTTESGSEKV